METLRMGSDSEFFDSYNDTTILDIRELLQALASVYYARTGCDKSKLDDLHDISEKYARDFADAIMEDESFEPSGIGFTVAALNLMLSMFYTVAGSLEEAAIGFDAAVMGGEFDDEH